MNLLKVLNELWFERFIIEGEGLRGEGRGLQKGGGGRGERGIRIAIMNKKINLSI